MAGALLAEAAALSEQTSSQTQRPIGVLARQEPACNLFSLVLVLTGSHARCRIFMRHHDIWCLVPRIRRRRPPPEWPSGVYPCRILDANVGESPFFHAIR